MPDEEESSENETLKRIPEGEQEWDSILPAFPPDGQTGDKDGDPKGLNDARCKARDIVSFETGKSFCGKPRGSKVNGLRQLLTEDRV